MKMTMTDGTVFEGSMAEHAELLAWAERKTEEETVVNAESKPKPFAEGDIVVITANTNDSCNTVGDIGKISEYVADDNSHRVLVSGNGNCGNWTLESEMRHATAEEIAQYEKSVADASKPKLKAGVYVKFTKRGDYNSADITLNKPYLVFADSYDDLTFKDDADDYREEPLEETDCYEILSAEEVAKHRESEKWAKIGREPGEFKVGDIAKVIKSPSALPNGTLFTVKDVRGCVVKDDSKAGFVYMVPEVQLELIAPVDARFDK